MKTNSLREFILIALMSLTLAITTSVPSISYAQTKKVSADLQYCFELSGGIQSFQLASNLIALNQSNVVQGGGSLGFIAGKSYWKAKINPIGFYYSNANSQVTTKLIESGAQINIYPIKLLSNVSSRIPQLYFSGGATRGKYKINGTNWTEGDQASTCIYDTFSTSIVSWNIEGGVGVEYQIGIDPGSITVFAEIKKAVSAGTSAYQEEFVNSSFKNFTMINMGISIGITP